MQMVFWGAGTPFEAKPQYHFKQAFIETSLENIFVSE
jgi:hypothetical protein